MKQLNFADVQTRRGYETLPSDYVNVYSITAGGTATVTVPTGATIASFSATGNFFVNFNGTTASGAAKTDGTGDELNPTTRLIKPLTSFTMYATAATVVSVAFYN